MDSVRNVKAHMELFQETFSHALTADSSRAPQPPHINMPLRPHQLAALDAMKTYEATLRYGMPLENGSRLFSQFAYLGDGIGLGKTLTILGHVSQCVDTPESQMPLSNLHPDSTSACFSILPPPSQPAARPFDTLIVVPFTLYHQWQTAILLSTTLKPCFLHQQRDVDKDTLHTLVAAANITLISNTLLGSFLINLRNRPNGEEPVWRRVFYDDADMMKLPAAVLPPTTAFTWLVSSRFENLLFSNQYYHSHVLRQLPDAFIETLHPELQTYIQGYTQNHPNVTFFRVQSQGFFTPFLRSRHPLRSRLVIRSSRAFVENSVPLPPLQQIIVQCETPLPFAIVSPGLPGAVEAALHAGDVQGALQSLGVPSHTPLTLVQAVMDYHEKKSNPAQLAALRERLEQVSKDSCSICFEEASSPCVTPCCSRAFCGACILQWLKRSNCCPLCREQFVPSQLIAIGLAGANTVPRRLKKIEALMDILHRYPQGQFIIFSHYENPFVDIENQMMRASIPVEVLAGPAQNKDAIAKRLADFEAGRVRVLLLSNRSAILGMNILSATHILLLHKMIPEEEKQILGCAYRMGRTKPLQFIKLFHERELPQGS